MVRYASEYIRESKVRQLIRRTRRQLVVHSILYYRMDNPLITDEKFDEISHRLVRLQSKYPEIAETVELQEDFKDWDGSTGFHLKSLYNPDFLALANYLLRLQEKPDEKKNKKVKISLYNV